MTPARSDHFNGKTFFNPGETGERRWGDLLRWKLTSRAARWPRRVAVRPEPPPAAPSGEGMVVTWIGHSTFLVRTAEGNFLTDPVFSERIGPVPGLGPRRVAAPGLAFDALPRIDAVLLSHDHYDHCDLPTLRRLAGRFAPAVVAPCGHGEVLVRAGLRNVVELDWWQSHVLAGGAKAAFVPARHWARRRPGDTNRRLWGGFVLRAGGRKLYFAGDTGHREGLFEEIAGRAGIPDLALIPIGAYEPRWFMRSAHLNPAEAVLAHRAVRARRSLGMHWGTFQLSDEDREAPVRDLEKARAEAGLPDEAFAVLPAGGSLAV